MYRVRAATAVVISTRRHTVSLFLVMWCTSTGDGNHRDETSSADRLLTLQCQQACTFAATMMMMMNDDITTTTTTTKQQQQWYQLSGKRVWLFAIVCSKYRGKVEVFRVSDFHHLNVDDLNN